MALGSECLAGGSEAEAVERHGCCAIMGCLSVCVEVEVMGLVLVVGFVGLID